MVRGCPVSPEDLVRFGMLLGAAGGIALGFLIVAINWWRHR